ncbi:pyridoxal 5'-phosphate synthase-like subunit PDX1.2 [Tanacetum coccineum]
MADESAVTIYNNNAISNNKNTQKNQFSVKVTLAQMLRGGAIVQVNSIDQAKTAQSAGACCLIVTDLTDSVNSVTRMPDPHLVKMIQRSVSIPVMARCRVGHFVEAQILESVGVDYIDENEVMGSLADGENFVNKHNFRVPFVCGCRDLGEGLRRVREGAAMIRTQGDNVGGDIMETVRNVRNVMGKIRVLSNMDEDEVFAFAKELGAPYDILAQTKQMGRLPVVHFASGGIVTPADAALMMQLGCDGVFVGNEVFECLDPYRNVRAIVEAVRNYNDARILAKVSSGLSDMGASGSGIGTELEEVNGGVSGINIGENENNEERRSSVIYGSKSLLALPLQIISFCLMPLIEVIYYAVIRSARPPPVIASSTTICKKVPFSYIHPSIRRFPNL